jgi:hypothetical protein
MSEQSHSCDPSRIAKERNRFLCYGALSIALAVGFGYSMASLKYQETFAVISENHQQAFAELVEASSKERASLHNRYIRQLSKRDKQIAELTNVCRPERAN